MESLPLIPSFGFSPGPFTWTGGGAAGRNGLPPGACRYCGYDTPEWMSVAGPDSVPVCILCGLCLSLDRPTIETEAAVIWFPEMTQAELISVARELHLICARHGASPTMDRMPRSRAPDLLHAYGLNAALLRRGGEVRDRLGTTSIREVGAAMTDLFPDRIETRLALLGGLRVLPLGRFLAGDEDIYPRLLASTLTNNRPVS